MHGVHGVYGVYGVYEVSAGYEELKVGDSCYRISSTYIGKVVNMSCKTVVLGMGVT